jgi:hypothetical protein
MKFGKVFIEAKYATNRRTNLGSFLWCEPSAMVYTDVDCWMINCTNARDFYQHDFSGAQTLDALHSLPIGEPDCRGKRDPSIGSRRRSKVERSLHFKREMCGETHPHLHSSQDIRATAGTTSV